MSAAERLAMNSLTVSAHKIGKETGSTLPGFSSRGLKSEELGLVPAFSYQQLLFALNSHALFIAFLTALPVGSTSTRVSRKSKHVPFIFKKNFFSNFHTLFHSCGQHSK